VNDIRESLFVEPAVSWIIDHIVKIWIFPEGKINYLNVSEYREVTSQP
jgi:hypothetical protein